jgi:DnaK suppressor protein
MNRKVLDSLATALRRRRDELLREVVGAEEDLRFIGEDRESELEERAQEERLARLLIRLDDRAKREIEEIAEALARIADNTYGICQECGRKIPLARLRALPAARRCVDCEREKEAGRPAAVVVVEEAPPPRRGRLAGDLALLSDAELEGLIREQLREDGRIDMEELRVVCRRGVAYLDGSLPSEAERRVLLHLVTDVIGVEEVVDRVRVSEILWEREDRSRREAPEARLPGVEPVDTEDVVESTEEGIDFVPPTAPIPEEEE